MFKTGFLPYRTAGSDRCGPAGGYLEEAVHGPGHLAGSHRAVPQVRGSGGEVVGAQRGPLTSLGNWFDSMSIRRFCRMNAVYLS